MFIDTHCHLNFKIFENQLDEVVSHAVLSEVKGIIVPGTDIESSKKAVKIVEKYPQVYAAVGIHPHHVTQYQISKNKNENYLSSIKSDLKEIEKLLAHPKTVALGEVGIDKHQYKKTVYKDSEVGSIDKDFIQLQIDLFEKQIKLASQYKKTLIIHNREAKTEITEVLNKNRVLLKDINSVFHCFEPDIEMLNFAKENNIFIGIDGDIFYQKDKQEFIKNIPLNLLVLETDSPYLSPKKKFPNEPKNIPLIADFIALLLQCSTEDLARNTTENAKRLFQLNDS